MIVGLNLLINALELLSLIFFINQYYFRLVNVFFRSAIIVRLILPIPSPASVWGGLIDCISGPVDHLLINALRENPTRHNLRGPTNHYPLIIDYSMNYSINMIDIMHPTDVKISKFGCLNAWMFQCLNVWMFKRLNVWMLACSNV